MGHLADPLQAEKVSSVWCFHFVLVGRNDEIGLSIWLAPLAGQCDFSTDNGYKVWEDQSFIMWRKRDPHITLHCHNSIEGSLKFWYECNKVDEGCRLVINPPRFQLATAGKALQHFRSWSSMDYYREKIASVYEDY